MTTPVQSPHYDTPNSYGPPPPSYPPSYYGRNGGSLVGSQPRQWAMVAHVGSFLAAWVALGVLSPLILILARGHDRFVRHHAYESLNFQLNTLMWVAISVVLMPLLIGFPLIVVVGIWYLVFVIRAGIAANNGEWYRYPTIVRFVRP